jgi:hypothetical protein
MSLLHRVHKLFELGVGEVHVELRHTLLGLAIELGHGLDAVYFPSLTTEPVNVFFLVARALEERYTAQRDLEWHFRIAGECMNAAFVQAIASVATARDRATRLVGLHLDDTAVKYDASVLRPLFEGKPSSSIKSLSICTRALPSIIVAPSLEKLTVTQSGEAGVILPFAQRVGVKTLCLKGAWPMVRRGEELAIVPALESLEISMHGRRPRGIRRLCAFISACPNLLRLSVDHEAWEDEYLAECFLEQVVKLEGLRELAIPASSELIPSMIPYLARLRSLRELVTLDWRIDPDIMRAIAWYVPRLSSVANRHGGSDRRYDDALRARNEWLRLAVLVSYLPLGDLHRELMEYLFVHK